MSRGLIFWILMLLWLVFGVWGLFVFWPRENTGFIVHGGTFLQFILFLLLGWECYGAPVKGGSGGKT